MHCRISRQFVVWGALALFGLGGAACGSSAPANSVTVRDSLGISIVEHQDPPETEGPPLRLEPSPVVMIGVVEEAKEYQFFGVTDAEMRSDGSIVVLDRSQTLRAFDSAGVYLWTAGGKGDGPGEFNWAQRIVTLPGDTLAVWDVGPGRLSLFNVSGDFVRAWTVPDVAATALLLGAADDMHLVLEQRIMERGIVDGHAALTVNSQLHWLNVATSEVEALGRRRSSIQYQEVDENGAFSPAIFGTAAVFAAAPRGFWYGQAKTPELERVARGLGVDLLVRWKDAERAVRESDVEAVVDKWSSTPGATPDVRRQLAEYARTHPRAERFPPYEELMAGPSGEVWVRDLVREHEDDGIRRWTVLSADGTRILGRLEHEARFKPLRMTLEGVLGVERDDLDIERVTYHRVAR